MRYKSYQWLIFTFLGMVIQALGNTSLPEIKNFGIMVSILFLTAIYMETQNIRESKVRLNKN